MSSLEEDSFGWTTTSSDSDIMPSEGNQNEKESELERKLHKDQEKNYEKSFNDQLKRKPLKRKIKEEPFSSSEVESPKKKNKKAAYNYVDSHIQIKEEYDSVDSTPTKRVKKEKNKHIALSSTVISNDHQNTLDISESSVFRKKSKKKKKKHNVHDDTQLFEISQIENEDISRNLESSKFFKDTEIIIKNEYKIKNMEITPRKQKKKDSASRTIKEDNLVTEPFNHIQTTITTKYINKELDNEDNETANNENNVHNSKTEVVSAHKKKKLKKSINEKNTNLSENVQYDVTSNSLCVSNGRKISTGSSIGSVDNLVDEEEQLHKTNMINRSDNKITTLYNNDNGGNIKKEFININEKLNNNPGEITFKNSGSDSDSNSTSKNDVAKIYKRLPGYIKMNKKLKPVAPKQVNDSFLTKDDDFWILNCPCEIDIKSLSDKHFNLDNTCKIKIDGQTYDGTLYDDNTSVSMLSVVRNKYVIKNLVPNGTVQLRKRIPKAHMIQDNAVGNNSNCIPLPEMKYRHPLFGTDYKPLLKLLPCITKNLPNPEISTEENIKNSSRMKMKNHKKELEEDKPVRKKRKRVSGESDLDVASKKFKQDRHAKVWDSEKAIEENLFTF